MIAETESPDSSSSHCDENCSDDVYEPTRQAMLTDKSILKKRDLEFPQHDVTVVGRQACIGASSFYEAKPNSESSKSGTSVSRDRNFLMKATVASTREQARRAEAEVRILRRLPKHRNILQLVDSGCSEMESDPESHKCDDNVLLDLRRVYCLLFQDNPSRNLRDIMAKHRDKLDRSTGNSGWIRVETALGIFRQMAVAVSVMHGTSNDDDQRQPSTIVHMDLRPENFAAFKTSRDINKGSKYIVKLVGAGCAMENGMPLYSVEERMKAARLIDSNTAPRYRAPEMVNLQLTDELTDAVDIWALGCCLYGILFLKDCFRGDERLNILKGEYEIPVGHPYSKDVIDLLARMLCVNPNKRPVINEVITCIDALASGKSLPPRKGRIRRPCKNDGQHSDGGETSGFSRRSSVGSTNPSRSQCDGTLSTWDCVSDMSTSVETEVSSS